MSTPYGISTSNGTFIGNVGTPITGPLGTKAPNAMPQHNYGVLSGLRPTPPQFGSSYGNPIARHQYFRTAESANSLAIQRERALAKASHNTMFNFASGVKHPISGHMNYIAPVDSSSHIDKLKRNAVGKTSYKVTEPTSTKVYTPSDTRSSLRRARSSGCVAPKKKGAY
jgi:hypothetical protein